MSVIRHLVSDYWRPGRVGGGARYSYELYGALRGLTPGHHHEALLVSNRRGRPYLRAVDDLTRTVPALVATDGLRADDWVVVHNLDSVAFDLGLMAKARSGCQLAVVDLGGAWAAISRALGGRRYHFVDRVLSISEFATVALRSPPAKTSVIYGGGDHILRSPLPEAVPSFTDFLYVGRITEHKGIDLLADALPRGKSLRVMGPAVNWSAPYGRALSQRLAACGADLVADPSDSDVRGALRSTGFLVLPTRQVVGGRRLRRPELLGLVVLEALAEGVRSIVSSAGSLPEIAAMTGGTVVAAGELESLRRVLADASPQSRGRERLPARLTWAGVARATAAALGIEPER